MGDRKILSVILLTSLTFFLMVQITFSCNQMLCASIVSKCMLTQSCKCDLKNCTCCRDCYQCLSWLWEECCSCVDLCPKPNDTKNPLSKQSHYEELEGIPGLFNALLDDPDEEKWSVFTFPVDYDASLYGSKSKDSQFFMQSSDDLQSVKDLKTVTVNCSIAYMAPCMTMTKCREACSSMGANSYRWFFDGCCECIGSTCHNHGIDQSRCLECPETKIGDGNNNSLEPIPPSEEDLEYGENMQTI